MAVPRRESMQIHFFICTRFEELIESIREFRSLSFRSSDSRAIPKARLQINIVNYFFTFDNYRCIENILEILFFEIRLHHLSLFDLKYSPYF